MSGSFRVRHLRRPSPRKRRDREADLRGVREAADALEAKDAEIDACHNAMAEGGEVMALHIVKIEEQQREIKRLRSLVRTAFGWHSTKGDHLYSATCEACVARRALVKEFVHE